ncbi:MAG TPA: Fmu (Sun) domain-containing protein [Chitinophagaceae bacterium]
MSFAHRYLETAIKITAEYNGAVPLHHYLKEFFAAHRKHGSTDRKSISHACYCYYRLGHAMKAADPNEKMKAGIFLCTPQPANWKALYDERWLSAWSEDLRKRIDFCQNETAFRLADVFPFTSYLSAGVEPEEFTLSHLLQPDLHLRLRPGKEALVRQQLHAAGISFINCSDTCIALPNGTKIETLINLNTDAIVQDHSSQRVGGFFSSIRGDRQSWEVWDCCAASGGKSILAYDCLGRIRLTVSDLRASIISNLRRRFAAAGIKDYTALVADLTTEKPVGEKCFDLVICDAPCSGSGTWSRNPEQLCFFNAGKIGYYVSLQSSITRNVILSIKEGGYLLYITCSVFKPENESAVEEILSHKGVKLIRKELLKGYGRKADTMFAALFTVSPL